MPTAPPPTKQPRLTQDHVKLLGKIADRDLAKQAGVSERTIQEARKKLRIPPARLAPDNKAERSQPGLQSALTKWPHRMPGIGIAANILLAAMHAKPQGMTFTECAEASDKASLGKLINSGLAAPVANATYTLYGLTPQGRDYLDLLKHANLLR